MRLQINKCNKCGSSAYLFVAEFNPEWRPVKFEVRCDNEECGNHGGQYNTKERTAAIWNLQNVKF